MILLITQALAGGLSVKDGRVGFATPDAVGVVDGTGRLEWSLPVTGVVPSAVALLGTQLWVFAEGEVWVFTDGRLSGVFGARGGPTVTATVVEKGVTAWSDAGVLRFGTSPASARIEPAPVTSALGAGLSGVTPGIADKLPVDVPCTLVSAAEAICGRTVLNRVRVEDGMRLGTVAGSTVLATGPAGIIVGPTPAYIGKDGLPHASFDKADGWAVGSDTIYAARGNELRAFSLDGKTRWATNLRAAVPPSTGLIVEGDRTSLVVDPATGNVLGGWLGRAAPESDAAKGRALASVKGRSIISNSEVGKGRKKHAAWTVTLADGERVIENAATIVVASEVGWRLFDGRNGKALAAGEGKIEENRRGWLRIRDANGQRLVRVETGQELRFTGTAEVVGVLEDGALVVADAELVVSTDAGVRWSAPRPASVRVEGSLVLCQDAGVLYARQAADGAVAWMLPFAEPLR